MHPFLLLLLAASPLQVAPRDGAALPPARLQVLDLPGSPEAALRVRLLLEDAPVALDLRLHSSRGPEFGVLVHGADGNYEAVEPPPVRTYTGQVLGRPELRVVASFTPESGLQARILAPDGSGYDLRPSRIPGAHELRAFSAGEAGAPACGTPEDAPAPLGTLGADPDPPTSAGLAPGGGDPTRSSPRRLDCLEKAEIAFDADFEFFVRQGGTVAATVARIETILAEVNFFYERDVQITHELTQVVVRTAPFYTPVDGGDLLNQFRNEWNTTLAGVPRDLAHLMTSKPGSLIQYGGLAFVGVVCGQSAYGWSMDGANIVGHEVGHNWGAGHCHDPIPCNNMCGACFYVAPITRSIILAHRDSRGCLESIPRLRTNHPPYVLPETVAVVKAADGQLAPLAFDVLANDFDGDCEGIDVGSFDAGTQLGGTVALTPDGARGGRPLLEYQAPPDTVGEDRFAYEVTDVRGASTSSEVVVEIRPRTLAAYWPMDDAAGDVAKDLSGNGNHGLALNPAVWVQGQMGGGLRFAGGQEVTTNLPSFQAPWTVSLWVKRLTNNSTSAVLLRGGNGSLKLEQLSSSSRIGVSRDGGANAAFILAAPLDTWIHLTFVGRRNRTELYANGGFVDSVPVSIDAPTGPIGTSVGTEKLKAVVDELRIFPYAFSRQEVGEFFMSGRPDAPLPPDGGAYARPGGGALSWLGLPGASMHELYFGTDAAAVRDATPLSPEYQGLFASPSFVPSPIAPGTSYFWRVAVPGFPGPRDVWGFELADFRHWPLDELTGTVAEDLQGEDDGTYRNGVVLGQPGATPKLGSAVYLDGVNDFVQLPALNLNTDRATFTTWLRRDGSQPAFAGLVFSRAQSTTAGLNLGSANELRYHWNDSGSTWGWDSGLVVPNDTWVFAALVVEPDRARLFLGQGGVLSSATNPVPHAPEEFDGLGNIGRDPTGGRHFRGWMDDTRVYRGALSEGQLEALYLESL